MKQFILILFTAVLAQTAIAQQSSIIVYTKLDSVKFRIFVNEERLNNFHTNEFEVEDLAAGNYLFRLVFENDSVADVKQKVKLKANQTRKYEIIQSNKLEKGIKSFGRKIDKVSKEKDHKGDHKWSDKYLLKEIY